MDHLTAPGDENPGRSMGGRRRSLWSPSEKGHDRWVKKNLRTLGAGVVLGGLEGVWWDAGKEDGVKCV